MATPKIVCNSTPHSWRHKRACKALLDWYSDKQPALSLKNSLLESSPQKTRSPIFTCPCSRVSSSQVQLHLDNRFLGNSNSPLIRTKSDSLGFTSYIYRKFNFENPKPRSQQCFVAPFLCISLMIPFTLSDFMLCLSENQSPNALRVSIFRQVCGALLVLDLMEPKPILELQTSAGFEPVTSAILVQCSTNWAMKLWFFSGFSFAIA